MTPPATRYRNRLEGRSGTLWESRYKSSVVQTDTYLLACSRYIELNPVRACTCAEPGDYPCQAIADVSARMPRRTGWILTLASWRWVLIQLNGESDTRKPSRRTRRRKRLER